MTKFSKFILSSMIVLAGVSISAPLYSMEGGKYPHKVGAAGLTQKAMQPNDGSEEQVLSYSSKEEYERMKQQQMRTYRRGLPDQCAPVYLLSLCVGVFLAANLTTQAVQYLLNN